MQQYIGSTGVMAWVKRITSPGHNIQKARELKSYTDKESVSGSPENMVRSEGPGLPAHELTHVRRQTRPQNTSQVQIVNRKDEPESARSVSPGYGAVNPSTVAVQSLPVPASGRENRIQASSDEQVTERPSSDSEAEEQPQVDVRKVADKVYRLMQRDLVLENERATRIGG